MTTDIYLNTSETKANSGFRFQQRDSVILKAIHDYDGVLARRHIKWLFWPDKGWRSMEKRLAKLYEADYVTWPSLDERKSHPIPEAILWLNWKGALYLAGKAGIFIETPNKINENQLRTFERKLKEQGFYWLRTPRWSQLGHDLKLVDIRLGIQDSLAEIDHLVLEEYINESTFRVHTDVVSYPLQKGDGSWVTRRRGVIPDGYFSVVDTNRRNQGQPHKARFLLEVDMATHDNPSFGNEKVLPGLAYLKSKAYRDRFGSNAGLWLVVTTGDRRMKNLIRQTLSKARSQQHPFLFTTFASLNSANFFRDPIWIQSDLERPKALIER